MLDHDDVVTLDVKLGNDLRSFLQQFGSKRKSSIIKQFLGRKPKHDAFLKSVGASDSIEKKIERN